jgi:hypothetical protein
MKAHSLVEFVWLPTFERASSRLLGEEDRREIEVTLCRDLAAGSLMKRTGGFRKLRHATRGSGKRGSVRVVYFPDERCGRVYMILAYAKGRKEALTRAEENELRNLATKLKPEDC